MRRSLPQAVLMAATWAAIAVCPVPGQTESLPPSLHAGAIRAATEGDIEHALVLLETVVAEGRATPRTHYNIGILLYQMGRLHEAEASFLLAADHEDLAGLAYLHLARIARDRGERSEAETYFDLADRRLRSEVLRDRIAAERATLPSPPAAFLLLIEIAGGYDSAAGFEDREEGRFGDFFGSFWLYAERPWSRGPSVGPHAQMSGSLAAVGYAQEHDANLFMTDMTGRLYAPFGLWTCDGGLEFRHIRMAEEALDTSLGIFANAGRPLRADTRPSATRLDVRVRQGFHKGGPAYAYLDGQRQDLRVRLSQSQGPGRWNADYTWEQNQRDDLHETGRWLSASPTRHRLGMSYRQPLGVTWHIRLAAAWRVSRYPANPRDGQRRRDDQASFSGTIARRPKDRNWGLFGRAEWLSNDSSAPAYTYDRFLFTAGAEYFR